MIKIVSGITEDGFMVLTVETPLIENYYPNLVGMLKDDESIPTLLEIKKEDKEKALLRFPLGVEPKKISKNEVMLPSEIGEKVKNISNVINRFSIAAIKHKFKKIEFVPLYGYPIEKLKDEIPLAVQNKRDLNIVIDFANYERGVNGESKDYTFNQYLIPYGTEEYTNVVLDVMGGRLSKLRKEYKDKLKNVSWV